MRPIRKAAAAAMPKELGLFVEWVQSSRELRAAILQNTGEIAERRKHSRECLDAYVEAVRDRLGKLEEALETVRLHLSEGARLVQEMKEPGAPLQPTLEKVSGTFSGLDKKPHR